MFQKIPLVSLLIGLLTFGSIAFFAYSHVPVSQAFIAADGSEVINCTFPDGTSKRMTRDECRAQGGGDNGCVGDEVSVPGGGCAQTLTGSGSSGSQNNGTSKSPSSNTKTPAGTTNTDSSSNADASSDNSFRAPDGSEVINCTFPDGTSKRITRDQCRAQGGSDNGCPGDEVYEGGHCVQPITGGSGTPNTTPPPTNPNPGTPSNGTPSTPPSGTGPGNLPPSGTGPGSGCDSSTSLCNPLKVDSVEELLLTIIDVVLVFLLPVIVLYIMYAGYLFVTAQGNPGELKTAKSALLTALIGGVIVLGARAILDVVKNTIGAVTTDSSASTDTPTNTPVPGTTPPVDTSPIPGTPAPAGYTFLCYSSYEKPTTLNMSHCTGLPGKMIQEGIKYACYTQTSVQCKPYTEPKN